MAYDDFVENDGEVGCREAGLLERKVVIMSFVMAM